MSDSRRADDGSDQVTITVSPDELRLIRSALGEFLASFSHEEGDVIDRIKALLKRLPAEEHGVPDRSSFGRLTL